MAASTRPTAPDAALWAGPEPAWWGERLACSAELAGALVQAAVRETFEECGVLLAGPDVPAADTLAPERAALVARRRTLGTCSADAALVLRSDLLRAWSRWITPEESPRRYDTVFFVARVPAGQDADAHTTEAVEAAWWHPAEALERWERGRAGADGTHLPHAAARSPSTPTAPPCCPRRGSGSCSR